MREVQEPNGGFAGGGGQEAKEGTSKRTRSDTSAMMVLSRRRPRRQIEEMRVRLKGDLTTAMRRSVQGAAAQNLGLMSVQSMR